MTATAEDVVAALVGVLQSAVPAAVACATVRDEDPTGDVEPISEGGQVAVYLDDRGVPLGVNGGAPFYRESVVHVECLVVGPTAATRRARLRALIDAVEAALQADVSLSGLASGLSLSALDPSRVPVEGAEDAATETIEVVVEFESGSEI